MIEVLAPHANTLISSFVVGFVGWFFGRRRTQIDNAEKLLQYYQNLANDLGKRLELAIEKFNKAEQTIRELEEKVEDLTSELRKYKQLNGKTS